MHDSQIGSTGEEGGRSSLHAWLQDGFDKAVAAIRPTWDLVAVILIHDSLLPFQDSSTVLLDIASICMQPGHQTSNRIP